MLQLHIISSGRFPSILQLISISLSICSIGKVGIELFIGLDQFTDLGFWQKNIRVLKLLPLFITSLVFRTGVLLILATHLNWWTILPILLALLMVMLLASEHGQQPIESLMAGLANVFIISPGIKLSALNRVDYKHEFQKISQLKVFYKKSSFFIFIFYTGLLNSFLFFYYLERNGTIRSDWFNMPYWGRKVFNQPSFKPVGGLYSLSLIIFLNGFLNILLTWIYFDNHRSSGILSGKISPMEKDESNSEPEPYDSGEMVDQEEDEESEKVNDED